PVIITDQVAIHGELKAAGVGGVVTCDADALAAELRRWLADDSLRRSATQKARPFVWEQYDWSQIAGRWAGHYRRLMDGVQLGTNGAGVPGGTSDNGLSVAGKQ